MRRGRQRRCRGRARAASLPLLGVLLAAAVGRDANALGGAEGAGGRPAMGWNSWNSLRCEGLSHDAVLRAADKLVSSGLARAGYDTVVIDDCWMASRDASGGIVPDAAKFPFGMAAVADAVHERGLKFGIYSDSGLTTCEGFPGSQGYEELDAATYASWGVDFLKYDFCNDKRPAREAYSRMARALQSTGRDIRFSLCSWGAGAPWQWGATVGHSWRTGRDLFAAWDGTAVKALGLPNYLQSVLEAADNQARLARFAGPGGFNDPDMLVVGLERGMTPYGIVDKCPPAVPDCKPGEYITRERWGYVGGLTFEEQRSHFALWSIMAAPLMLGNDLANEDVSAGTLEILTAEEVLAIDQDALGIQGRPTSSADGGEVQVWSKALADGRVALLLLNRAEAVRDVRATWSGDVAAALADAAEHAAVAASTQPGGAADACAAHDKNSACSDWAASGECERNAGYMMESCACACAAAQRAETARARAIGAAAVGFDAGARMRVRDAWSRRDLGEFVGEYVARAVPPHGHALIVVERAEAASGTVGDGWADGRAAARTSGGARVGAKARAAALAPPLITARETGVVLLGVVAAVALFALRGRARRHRAVLLAT